MNIIATNTYVQKYGMALMKLAREMMTYSIGDRIPTISEYVESYGCSKGTIQGAIKLLCENGLALEKMGHMGSYIKEINYSRLWSYTGWGTLVGLMPLPQNDKLKSLATALTYCMEQSVVPFDLAFMQSASNRIQAVEAGRFDFTIVSKLTSEIYQKQPNHLDFSLELHEDSYCNSNIIAFADPMDTEIRNGMRIAYDPKSPDQNLLTHILCKGKDVTLLTMPYRSTLHCLQKGKVDAIIYRSESTLDKFGFGIVDLPHPDLITKTSTATAITHKDNYHINKILQKFLTPDHIQSIQKKIAQGQLYPYY